MAQCSKCGRKMPGFSLGKPVCQWCVQYEKAQRGEETDDAVQPIMRAPWLNQGSSSMMVTQGFVIINVMIFVAMVLSGLSAFEPTPQELTRWGANFGPYTTSGEWWRLLTSVFLHYGIMHIAFNMWCLWDLGQMVESLYGHWTFFVVYLTCGVAGSLASAWWHVAASAGASGAIFGLAGALIASYYLGDFSMPRSIIQMRLRSILMFVGFNVVFGAISGITDNACHLGGLAAGLVFGALIAKLAPDSDAFFSRAAAVLLGVALVAGCGLWLDHARGYESHMRRGSQFWNDQNFDGAIDQFQRAAKARPDDTEAHELLAAIYAGRHQYDMAEAELKRTIQIEPKNAEAHSGLGEVYLAEQHLAQAQTAYQQALAVDSRNVNAHYGLAKVFAAEGNCTAVSEELLATQKIDEGFYSYGIMGACYATLKKWDDAIAAYQRNQQINGDASGTEAALARAYDAKGMKKEAEAARQKAAELKAKE